MIRDYLPKVDESTETHLVQAHIRKRLVDEVKVIMRRDKITWIQLITACLERFRDETASVLK